MRHVSASALALFTITLALLAPACGETGGTGAGGAGGAGGGGDGKYHPPGNGQHESEKDACAALATAQDARNTALGCTATSRPCPSLIQVMVGGTSCLEYDQGSVQGCIDDYNQQASCAD